MCGGRETSALTERRDSAAAMHRTVTSLALRGGLRSRHFRRSNVGQCPASEVRNTLQQSLIRTSEAKGHKQHYDSSAAFDLKFLNEMAASGAGTSNRRH
jgi:hypothetical protein